MLRAVEDLPCWAGAKAAAEAAREARTASFILVENNKRMKDPESEKVQEEAQPDVVVVVYH
jgi:hypothetical protein